MSQRIAIAVRIPEHQLEQIDRAADAQDLSRTQYIIQTATGELPLTAQDTLRRIDELETAVKRLQELAYAL